MRLYDVTLIDTLDNYATLVSNSYRSITLEEYEKVLKANSSRRSKRGLAVIAGKCLSNRENINVQSIDFINIDIDGIDDGYEAVLDNLKYYNIYFESFSSRKLDLEDRKDGRARIRISFPLSERVVSDIINNHSINYLLVMEYLLDVLKDFNPRIDSSTCDPARLMYTYTELNYNGDKNLFKVNKGCMMVPGELGYTTNYIPSVNNKTFELEREFSYSVVKKAVILIANRIFKFNGDTIISEEKHKGFFRLCCEVSGLLSSDKHSDIIREIEKLGEQVAYPHEKDYIYKTMHNNIKKRISSRTYDLALALELRELTIGESK